jgi:hypothetical protein
MCRRWKTPDVRHRQSIVWRRCVGKRAFTRQVHWNLRDCNDWREQSGESRTDRSFWSEPRREPASTRVFPLTGVKWPNRGSTNGFVHRDRWPGRPPSFSVQNCLPSLATSSIIRPAAPVSKFADKWLCLAALSCSMDRSGRSAASSGAREYGSASRFDFEASNHPRLPRPRTQPLD